MLTAKAILLAATMIPISFTGADRGKRLSAPMPEAKSSPRRARNKATNSPRSKRPLADPIVTRPATSADAMSGQNAISNDAMSPLHPFKTRAFQQITARKPRKASTRKFVDWLRDYFPDAPMSKTRVLAAYAEFCDYHDVRPLTERQVLTGVVNYGVEKHRPTARVINGKVSRPTTYTVKAKRRRAA